MKNAAGNGRRYREGKSKVCLAERLAERICGRHERVYGERLRVACSQDNSHRTVTKQCKEIYPAGGKWSLAGLFLWFCPVSCPFHSYIHHTVNTKDQ